MLYSLEIIENIPIAQLNFEKNSFGRSPKSRDSSGTQDQLGTRINLTQLNDDDIIDK